MSASPTTRRRARWAVPAAVTVAVAAAVAIPSLATAADAELPETTAAELLATMAQTEPTPLSGTAIYTARLGLPDIAAQLTGGADPLNLLGGSSTIRIWSDGGERTRVSLLGTTSEYSAVTDSGELWTYSSAKNTVTHVSLDDSAETTLTRVQARLAARSEAMTTGDGGLPTPSDLAEQVLEQADEHSEVSLGDTTTVAGRLAYQVVVTPRSDETLVDRIVLAVDGKTFIPLSVQAWSTTDATKAALELAFTDISYAPPSDAALAFASPAGAEVVDHVITLDELDAGLAEGDLEAQLDGTPGHQGTAGLPENLRVLGDGWATIVERSGVEDPFAAEPAELADELAELADELAASPWAGTENADLMDQLRGEGGFELDITALFDQLTTQVDGGRVLTTPLVSMLLTDDGRVLIGAVPADALLAAAELE